jgi:hypothetical protein
MVAKTERNEAIVAMAQREPPLTLHAIGESFGISHQRVLVILTRADVRKRRARASTPRFCQFCGNRIRNVRRRAPGYANPRRYNVCVVCSRERRMTPAETRRAARARRADAGLCTYCQEPRVQGRAACAYHLSYYLKPNALERKAK